MNQQDRLARAAEAYRRGDLSRHEFQGLVLAALGQLGEGDEILRVLLTREIAQVWQNVNELVSGKPLISVGSTPHLDVENEKTGAHVFDIFIRHGTETFRNLDFHGAAKNVLTDARGDWFQDPWELQEVKWLSERGQHVLDATLISQRLPVYGTAADVPKSADTSRPATILDPLGRLIYQAVVDAQSTRLTSHLANWTYGWRVPSGSMIPGEYVQNQFEWTEY